MTDHQNVVEKLLDRVERLMGEVAHLRNENSKLRDRLTAAENPIVTGSIAERLKRVFLDEENRLHIATPHPEAGVISAPCVTAEQMLKVTPPEIHISERRKKDMAGNVPEEVSEVPKEPGFSRLKARAHLNSLIGNSHDPVMNLRPTRSGIFTIHQLRHVQTEFEATMEADPLRHATKVIEDLAQKYRVSTELMRVIVNRVSYYTDENIAKFIADNR